MNYAKCFMVVAGAWLPALGGFAQDVLTKRNGDELQVKVTKVSADEVEYKKWANPDGPSYVVPKAEVFMIKYQNGDKDVFDPAPAAKPAPQGAGFFCDPRRPSAPVRSRCETGRDGHFLTRRIDYFRAHRPTLANERKSKPPDNEAHPREAPPHRSPKTPFSPLYGTIWGQFSPRKCSWNEKSKGWNRKSMGWIDDSMG